MGEGKNFRDYDQSQGVFRTITPEELLEAEHPARIVSAVVERLDLSTLYELYSDEGNAAYHPKMMLKVLFYGYLTGMMSCRGMWEGLKDRADYIYLSGDQVPDFRTINRFRLVAGTQLPWLFSQIVHLCAALGMVGFKHLAVDGQKIQASASFRQTKNKERYLKSLRRVKEGMKKLLATEPEEEFTEAVKEQRLKRLKKREEKLDRLAKDIEELQDDEQVNLTDPDAKQMKHKDGRSLPSYNHQSAVDGKLGVTVAVKTHSEAFDHSQHLLPLVDAGGENAGGTFEHVMADSGFCDFEILEAVESRPEQFYLPDRDFKKEIGKGGKYTQNAFHRRVDGAMVCPAGLAMQAVGQNRRNDGVLNKVYQGVGCATCAKKPLCTGVTYRRIAIDERHEVRERMRTLLRTPTGRETYMKRQGIVEPAHGNDQKNLGWRQHHLRSLSKASIEFMLVRIGTNIGKIAAYRAQEMLQWTTG